MIDPSKIADAERHAQIATLKRELALVQKDLQDQLARADRLQRDNDDLSQKMLTRAKRDGESSVLIDRVNDLRIQLRDVERSRDNALTKVTELELLNQQYINQVEMLESGQLESDELKAVKKELEELKDKSRRELKQLQDELDEQISHNQSPSVDSDSILEVEVLRQESEVLNQTLTDRQKELQESQQTCQLLEDELEDAHAEIDELRRQLEKQEKTINDLEAAEKQAAASVNDLLTDEIDESTSSVPVVNIKSTSGFSVSKWGIPIIVGAVIMIVVLEIFSLAGGKGELFKAISGAPAPESSLPSTSSPEPVVEAVKPAATATGQINR